MGGAYFNWDEDDWDGDMIVAAADVEYFPWRHVGFGLGYSYAKVTYDELDDSDALNIDYEYEGFLLRAIASF